MKIYLVGSFTEWKKYHEMKKEGDRFILRLKIQKGIHLFKFIVDGEWRFSPEHNTTTDANGNINNVIDTTFIYIADIPTTKDSNNEQESSGKVSISNGDAYEIEKKDSFVKEIEEVEKVKKFKHLPTLPLSLTMCKPIRVKSILKKENRFLKKKLWESNSKNGKTSNSTDLQRMKSFYNTRNLNELDHTCM